MEINEKRLIEILTVQRREMQQYVGTLLRAHKKESELRVVTLADGLEQRTVALTKEFERYVGALKEDFDDKFDAVMEYVKDVPVIKEKQNMMFETMGEMAVDIAIIKEAVKDHEVRLQRLEAR